MQFKALVFFAIAAVLFVIFAAIAKKAAGRKAQEEIVKAEAGAVSTSVDADKLAKLESENEELKAMVASLASDIATVKQ